MTWSSCAYLRSGPNFLIEEFDCLVSRLKRAVAGTFESFGQARIDDAALRWGVLVGGGWELWNDVDNSTGHLELHAVAGLDASTALYLGGTGLDAVL